MKGKFEIPASKRAIFVFIIIWLVVVSVSSRCNPIAMLTDSWKTSTSTRYGFSVDHPKWWIARSYGEGGYRGDDEVIFIISSNFDPGFNGIEISRQVATSPSPTVWEVAEWGERLQKQRKVYDTPNPDYSQTPLQILSVDGYTVLSRTYKRGSFTDEDIYIARAEDMIIITLRTSNGQYEKYLDEFTRVWESFTPLE